MPVRIPASNSEIRDVARKTVDVFLSRGLTCCLFGGAACSLFGLSRTPNDVDIVVLTSSYTTEQLKQMLVQERNADFYTVQGRGAAYRVLWCRLPSTSIFATRRSCKVDILIPGIMDIPFVPPDEVIHIDDLPVMPFIAVLLLKVQGWSAHRASARGDFQQKQYVDVRDIKEMLSIASRRGDHLSTSEWLPVDFLRDGRERILRFIEYSRQNGQSLSPHWAGIGFVTS